VEVRETHISWVFLTADRAYKLKKPVVLPYLDYGTPERRREMCREEVRLNRRLAGDLYLGVRALTMGAEGLSLGAEEDPHAVDYVVEMKRYEESRTLAAKLQAGEHLAIERERAVLDSLARALVAFHSRARRVSFELPGALVVEQRLDTNFEELLALISEPGEVARMLALERFVHAFLAAYRDMFDTRAKAGLVVEGHGDLRAEHVLLDGAVRVVDCIEFNRRLRELDVADELAFLVMDLTVRGAQRVARGLVNAYRNAGGDPGDDELIAFYACFRALVRAKVALTRARQSTRGRVVHMRESSAAGELLTLAERFSWQARLPLVILVCGLPAAGKSKLARALGAASGLPLLSSDLVRKQIVGAAPGRRAPEWAYNAEWDRRTYDELGRLAANAVTARRGALVDATFRRRADREAFAAAFGRGAPLLYVECQAPLVVRRERAISREADPARISDASVSVVEQERHAWEPLEEVPPEGDVTLRSDRPIERQLADLLVLLDRRLARLTR
jgi:uncharacterized protein